MSGGVDSSVAAALLRDDGHEVVGCTLRLWGGESDSGCCSAADVDDARRVAQVLGIEHHVFNLSSRFDDDVVAPYVAAHASGATPNPCVECNRSIEFGALLERSDRLGFDALATGHHARVVPGARGPELRRGLDRAKDQSYVLGVLDARRLTRVRLPVGELTKSDVRERAAALGLRTADKPDSQEVCFIPRRGRRGFLAARTALTPGTVVDRGSGAVLGRVDAVELVTVGQRRGLGTTSGGAPRYAVDVDVATATVLVSTRDDVAVDRLALEDGSMHWITAANDLPCEVLVQTSAHGPASAATLHAVTGSDAASGASADLELHERVRPVAPGQLAVFYEPTDPDLVIGTATIARARAPQAPRP
jgi:tRNA-uridine 2-sulfurtransferase